MMRFCHCLPDTTGDVRHTCGEPPVGRFGLDPRVCPVCSGRTTVPAEFYPDGPLTIGTGAAPPPARKYCRSCGGTGVVWSPEQTRFPPSM